MLCMLSVLCVLRRYTWEARVPYEVEIFTANVTKADFVGKVGALR